MADKAAGAPPETGAIDKELRHRWGWMPYRLLGGAALFSCGFVVMCDFVMWFLVDGYNPLSQTISELGAGPHQWLQDTGIVVFMIGILALTVGLILRGKGTAMAWTARASFILLSIDIALIALWNEYGDGDNGGLVLHPYFISALYILVALALWLGTTAAHAQERPLEKLGKATAIIWIVIAPFFYLMPESINGAYERLLALIMISAVGAAAVVLYRRPEKDM